jgi:hypothetical protein
VDCAVGRDAYRVLGTLSASMRFIELEIHAAPP